MVTYVINYTDTDKTPVSVQSKTVNQVDFPIAIFGRERLQYGELMNENILHLLENFACPEDATNPGNPDFERAFDNTLANAVEGQLWYNSTDTFLYIRNSNIWQPISFEGEISANFGTIAHGEQLPLPTASSGYVFSYEECAWLVAPRFYPDQLASMVCTTDPVDSTVNHQYSFIGDPTLIDGDVNYMIVAIRDNVNLGQVLI